MEGSNFEKQVQFEMIDISLPKHVIGAICERNVEMHLQAQNYQTLCKNFKYKHLGEIDLIMLKHEIIYFIEVKGRKIKDLDLSKEQAYGAISKTKIHKIRNMAAMFIQSRQLHQKTFCFLGAIILYQQNGKVKHIHYRCFN